MASTVPLMIYIGGKKKIVGHARVDPDGTLKGYLDEGEDGSELIRLVSSKVICGFSLNAETPPAAVPKKEGLMDRSKTDG